MKRFDDFDLYESCEEYYGSNKRVIDSYEYYLMHEDLLNEEENTYSNLTK